MPDKKKIYIRPGHGHDDSGAVAIDGKFEKDINLKVSLKLRDKLKDTFEIKLYREDDSRGTGVKPQLEESCSESNAWKPDLVICPHHNSAAVNTAKGYQVIIKDDEVSRKVGNLIAKEFEAIGQKSDGTGINVRNDLYQPKHTDAPFVLTEFCYLNNSADYEKVKTDDGIDKEAEAIAKAVASYFNTTISDSSTSSNTNNSASTGALGEAKITVVPNTKTNSDYENIDSKSQLVNKETGVKPDIYDLVNTPNDEFEALRKIDPSIPKPFSTMWDKGFIMDWALDVLETHEADTKDYTYERIEGYNSQHYNTDKNNLAIKKGYIITCTGKLKEDIVFILNQKGISDVKIIDSSKKNFIATKDMIPIGTKEQNNNTNYDEAKRIYGKTDDDTKKAFTKWLDSVPHIKFTNKYDDGFIDITDKGNDGRYEFLEYSTEDFKIDNFGGGTTNMAVSTNSAAGGGSALRQKIIDKAKEIVDKCANSKARYVLGGNRGGVYGKVAVDSNEIEMYDCSIFAEICYLNAGIKMPAPSGTQFTQCQNGGIISTDFERLKKEGKPGDLLFNGVNGSVHVAIYDGNGGQYAAHTDKRPIPQQITHTTSINGQFMYWGRCKELIEADKVVTTAGGTTEFPLADDLTTKFSSVVKDGLSRSKETVAAMNKYGYKNVLISTAQKYNIDPFIVLSLITCESTGEPGLTSSSGYRGLMQTSGPASGEHTDKPYDPASNIDCGCREIIGKVKAVKSVLGVNSMLLALRAYAVGEGNVQKYIKSSGKTAQYYADNFLDFVRLETTCGMNLAYGDAQYYIKLATAYKYHKDNKSLG